jgi:hypothetical protein
MTRHAILASVLALVGSCIDQGQPNVGTADQDLSIINPAATVYSNIYPVTWTSKFNQLSDYWDFNVGTTVTPPNLQMVAFVVNGEPAVPGGAEATRMVWLVSNSRVYKVYQVAFSDVAQMTQMTRNAFTNVENGYAAQGYASPGSTIIAGVDGGVVTKKGGGNPPHGFPALLVSNMQDLAATVRPVIINVQGLGAGSLD